MKEARANTVLTSCVQMTDRNLALKIMARHTRIAISGIRTTIFRVRAARTLLHRDPEARIEANTRITTATAVIGMIAGPGMLRSTEMVSVMARTSAAMTTTIQTAHTMDMMTMVN